MVRQAWLAIAIFVLWGSGLVAEVHAATSDISWYVKNPFRLILDQGFIDKYRRVNAALSDDQRQYTVLAMERALQKGKNRGWASGLVDDTCWSRLKRRLWTGDEDPRCANFISPKAHIIIVGPITTPAFSNRQCRWFADGNELRGGVPSTCGVTTELSIPYPGPDGSVDLMVEALDTDGSSSGVVTRVTVKVDDLLIVGLGDSFASGEGNPDLPVKMDATTPYTSRFNNKYPLRALDLPHGSIWVDRQCHRSLYSQQLRAALQLAFGSPHRAVAYIGLGCSGAEVKEGIMGKFGGVEKISKKIYGREVYKHRKDSQMKVLLGILCANGPSDVEKTDGRFFCRSGKLQRRIDYLLLSIGGNDIGFAKYVAYVIGNRYGLAAKIAIALNLFNKPKAEQTQEIAVIIKEGYDLLREQFASVGLIRNDEGRRVLLSAYPSPLYNEQGAICPGEHNNGMDFFTLLKYEEDKARKVVPVVAELRTQMKSLSESAPFQWTYVDEYLGAFKNHGWCAFGMDDFFNIPRLNDDGIWSYIHPKDLHPYRSRTRWFRTPNDAYLFVNRLQGRMDSKELDKDDVDYDGFHSDNRVKERRVQLTRKSRKGGAANGAMHPTAEGHAVIAGVLVKTLERLHARAGGNEHQKATSMLDNKTTKLVYVDIPEVEEPEFSGCMPATDDGSFWVASDENKKVIWKINGSGKFENGFHWDDKSHNDMEGLAADGSGGFFVLTSQSLNSRGESKKSRNTLSHFKDFNFDEGDRRTVSRFRNTLIGNFKWSQEALRNQPKEGGIDIEGIAYDPSSDRMWFGFRGPLVKGDSTSTEKVHALLIQLNHALEDWDPEDRNPPKEFSWASDIPLRLDLGGHGIRDLYYAGKDQLFILSGLMGSNPPDMHPSGKLWRLNTQTSELEFVREIPQVPDQMGTHFRWSAAEGVCSIKLDEGGKLLVVYDSRNSGIFRMLDFPSQ